MPFRGRPKKTDSVITQQKQEYIAGLLHLLEAKSSKEITSSELIAHVGYSRPTFYRLYPNGLSQVFTTALEQLYQPLKDGLVKSLEYEPDFALVVQHAVSAYFSWIRSIGIHAKFVFRENELEDSAVQLQRSQVLSGFVDRFLTINDQPETYARRYRLGMALTEIALNAGKSIREIADDKQWQSSVLQELAIQEELVLKLLISNLEHVVAAAAAEDVVKLRFDQSSFQVVT